MLGLVLDDLADLVGVNRREFDKFGENVEAGSADVDNLGLDAFCRDHVLQGLENCLLTAGFLRALQSQRFDREIVQAQSARLIDFEFGQLQAARSKINGQKCLDVQHSVCAFSMFSMAVLFSAVTTSFGQGRAH